MKVTILGTGIMGAPMARNLAQAGHDVVAWNRSREKAEAIDGVSVADGPAEAVAGAEVVVTMLADGAAVEDVIGQAIDAIDPAAVWWQSSTVGLEATERLRSIAGERGIAYVDAPVLGTKQPAQEGKLTVLASGPAEAVDKLAPLFDAVAAKTIRLGEAGEGTRAKLVLNNWLLALTTATAETIGLARALGLDPKLFLETIAGGPLDVAYAQTKGAAILEDRTGDASFPLKHAHKDAQLVLDAARSNDAELGLTAAVEERFARAVAAGLGDSDMAAVGKLSEGSDRRS